MQRTSAEDFIIVVLSPSYVLALSVLIMIRDVGEKDAGPLSGRLVAALR